MSRALRLLAPLALASAAAAQTTWHVDASAAPPGDGSAGAPFPTIQAALDAAAGGDTVRVEPGTYVENVDFLFKSVTVESVEGPVATEIVPAVPSFSTVAQGGDLASVLRGFTVRGNPSAAAVFVGLDEGLSLEQCVLRDNLRAVENFWELSIDGCTIVANDHALGHFAGGHGLDAVTSVEDTVFWDNVLDVYGTGIDPPEGLTFDWSLLDTDPLFFGPGDWHVALGSPCIDAGDPAETDPDGTRRDVGALPFDPNWPLGESFCTPTENSTGARATIHLAGSASVAANDLVLSGARCPANASGLFVYGTERAALPFGDGVLCVGGAVARLDPAPTGPLGIPTHALDLGALPTHVPPILPGETRAFSYWFRDLVPGGAGFNFTNAVEVLFVP